MWKHLLLGTIVLTISSIALADKFVITGKPGELDPHPGYFTFQANYRPTIGYRFVTFLNTPRVCFIEMRPEFVSLDRVEVKIEENGKRINWNCYRFDPRFFEIDF